MWGDPLFEVWGKPGSNNIKSAVTDQSHSDITVVHILFTVVFFKRGSFANFLHRTLPVNPELSKGWVYSGGLRMHRGCCKTYTSHVKRKDVFSSTFTIPTGSHWFSLVASSKGRQFTGSARRVGVRHLDSVYMHTPYQFCQSITPHSTNRRHISWSFKSQPRPSGFNGPPDNEEDAARIAILNKVMKGRQPTDLILRCK
jgi:hypothetical protein